MASSQVFVSGIPFGITKSQFEELALAFFGKSLVEEVILLMQSPTRNKGFGFVRFKDTEQAAKAATREWSVSGVRLTLKLSTPRAPPMPSSQTQPRRVDPRPAASPRDLPAKVTRTPEVVRAAAAPVRLPMKLAWAFYRYVLCGSENQPLPQNLTDEERRCIRCVEVVDGLQFIVTVESLVNRTNLMAKLKGVGFQEVLPPSLKRLREDADRPATTSEVLIAIGESLKVDGTMVAVKDDEGTVAILDLNSCCR